MRRTLRFISFGLLVLSAQAFAQKPIRWVQSTNFADNQQLTDVSRKLDETSPIKGLDKAYSLSQVMSMYPLAILIDEKALEEESITPNEPIRFPDVPGISIRNQLQFILEPLCLTYVEKPGYLVITSKKSSANVVRLYDVTRIVSTGHHGKFNFAPLIGIIERNISQCDWQIAGGNSNMTEWRTPTAGILVVSAPTETHDAIRDLFNAHGELLKKASARQSPNPSSTHRSSSVRRSELRGRP